MHKYKYILAFVLPILTWMSFSMDGWVALLPLFYGYILFPVLELFLPVDHTNLNEKILIDEKNESFYDQLLLLAAAIYVSTFIYFFISLSTTPLYSMEYWARIMSMGIIAGIFGFNVGHELTHRVDNSLEKFAGNILLLGSLNLHFVTFHHGGHHRNVGKPTDPSTARRGEWLYTYWWRSHIGGFFEAWRIDRQIAINKGHAPYSWHNAQVKNLFITTIYLITLFNLLTKHQFVAYLIVVLISIILLETINYIEHYGLTRKVNIKGKYEPVRHHHSWNSDHFFGRAMMFNLSRHSDHHYNGSIKYQSLKYIPETPQMPTGYPGMFVLAFIPPLWFYVMHKELDKIKSNNREKLKNNTP